MPASTMEAAGAAMEEATVELDRRRLVAVPIAGGELSLYVPASICDSTLNKEIAVQDIVRKRLLDLITKLEKIVGSNMELFVCPRQKLHQITGEFLAVCGELRKFIADFSTFHSAIPELEEAREDVQTFLFRHIDGPIKEIDDFQKQLFSKSAGGREVEKTQLNEFRKQLAKDAGVVRNELQKIFAHLFVRDPRNMYRESGVKSQQGILFVQFRRDVEVTDQLYKAVRSLDRYMRGAIVPSDLLQMTAERIERERGIACLFDADYSLFLNALVEEILERLLPELQGVLDLDGIWYDDFESIQNKAKKLYETCITFKVFYNERCELREKVRTRKAVYDKIDQRGRDMVGAMLAVFETHRYRAVAESIRSIDQILIDLEGTLLQWEKGITRRAFAQAEWGDAEPFRRRGERSVVLPSERRSKRA